VRDNPLKSNTEAETETEKLTKHQKIRIFTVAFILLIIGVIISLLWSTQPDYGYIIIGAPITVLTEINIWCTLHHSDKAD
jgi:hypothetical protein